MVCKWHDMVSHVIIPLSIARLLEEVYSWNDGNPH